MSKHKSKSYPVLENITITDWAGEGKSLARVDNKVIFIENAVPNDIADIEITVQKKTYSEGRAIRFHQYSSWRSTPFCIHFGVCGGCKWQNLEYSHQLKYKQQQVKDNLERIAKVEIPEIMPILGSATTKHYRNRLDFAFSNMAWLTEAQIQSGEAFDRRALGFHIPQRFDKVLNLQECFLQPEPSNQIRLALRDFAIANELDFYDIKNKQGFLRGLIIRNAESTQELMVLVMFFENDTTKIELVMNFLKNTFPQITSLLYVHNPKANDTIYDLEIQTFSGLPYLTEKMENLSFRIGAKSFYQTNSNQAYELYKVARNFAELTGNEVVYDLYTGTGTIANFVAHQAKLVIGLEYVEMSIEDAKVNSAINGITNTLFYAGDMRKILTPEFLAQHPRPDVIITDPPRAGMHEDVVQMLLEIASPRIVYVSCNPATQARDIALLDAKYKISKIQPVDMFPHTHHVENVVLLTLR
jgi:23S rRNA (uracil1939-C5)-methyltransferase